MTTDTIREYAREHYIEPARQHGDATVMIRVGDVHRAMGLHNRVPAVCQALSTRSFLEANRLVLEKREGPPSGQSTTVTFVYRLLDTQPTAENKWDRLRSMRGIMKDFYAKHGGGEKMIQEERDAFLDFDDRRRLGLL